MIKAIIFDCFGVLTTDWWREFLSTVPDGPGKQKAKELNHAYDGGLISLREFVKGVAQATGKEPKPIEDIFSTPKPVKNNELLNYIRSLKQDFKIGLLSNVGTNWIREHFLTAEEQTLFDSFVLSYEVGYTKPNHKIFELAASRLGVQPDEIIFVDDVATYCQAAEAVGMIGLIYTGFKQMKAELEKILAANSNK